METQETPEQINWFNEISLNKNMGSISVRSNFSDLKEIKKIILDLNSKGLIDSSAPSYIG